MIIIILYNNNNNMNTLFYKNTSLNSIVINTGTGSPAPGFTSSPPTSVTSYVNSRPTNVYFLYQGTDISQFYTAITDYFTTATTSNVVIGQGNIPSNVKSVRIVTLGGGGGGGGHGGNVNYFGLVNSQGCPGGQGGYGNYGYLTQSVTSGDTLTVQVGPGGLSGGNGNNSSSNNVPCSAPGGSTGGAGGLTTVSLNNIPVCQSSGGNGGGGGDGGRVNKTAPYDESGKNNGSNGNTIYGGVDPNWLNTNNYGTSSNNGYVQLIYLFD
jgi:hypothetical protein